MLVCFNFDIKLSPREILLKNWDKKKKSLFIILIPWSWLVTATFPHEWISPARIQYPQNKAFLTSKAKSKEKKLLQLMHVIITLSHFPTSWFYDWQTASFSPWFTTTNTEQLFWKPQKHKVCTKITLKILGLNWKHAMCW